MQTANSNADFKVRNASLLGGAADAAAALGHDVAIALAERVDELDTSGHDFRAAMTRVFGSVLASAATRSGRVLLFEETVPGFTLMLFRKSPPAPASARAGGVRPGDVKPGDVKSAAASPSGNGHAEPPAPERLASEMLSEQFGRRTGARVLVVEGADSVFVFFPAQDVRKSLREMGLYWT